MAISRTDLLRGVFDAATSIYVNRFLNIPAARIPEPATIAGSLDQLEVIFDKQHQVQAAAEAVSAHLYHDSNAPAVIMMLGKQLLREDRDFHTIQMFEATLRQVAQSKDSRASHIVLIAAARYLAAHAPTMRAQGQTFNIALRLAHGDRLFEE
jgi:hypothetical protein